MNVFNFSSALSPARATLPGSRTPSGRPQAGFTLIEVLFAIVIFGMGVMAMLLCVPMASNRVMKSGSQTKASSLASETAEELLTVPYGNSSITAGTHNDPANPRDGLYYTQWTVEDDVPIASCKRITINVARNAVSNPSIARIVVVTPKSGG